MPSARTIIHRLDDIPPSDLVPVRYLVRETAWPAIRDAAAAMNVLHENLILTGEVEVVPDQVAEVVVHAAPNPFSPDEGVVVTEGSVLHDGMDEEDDVVESRRLSRAELDHKIAEMTYKAACNQGRSHDQAIGDVARVMSLLEKTRSGS